MSEFTLTASRHCHLSGVTNVHEIINFTTKNHWSCIYLESTFQYIWSHAIKSDLLHAYNYEFHETPIY